MIQTYSYLVGVGNRSPEEIDELKEAITGHAQAMVRINPHLRGLKQEVADDGKLRIMLRVSGLTRWHIGHSAPRILSIILRKFKLPIAEAAFERMDTEPNLRTLRAGEGRTEATRRPRAERAASGRPGDHTMGEGNDAR